METIEIKAGRRPLEARQNTALSLTRDLIAGLDAEARRTADSRSRLARQAIAEFLARRQQETAKAA